MKFKVSLNKRLSGGGYTYDFDVVVDAKDARTAKKIADAQFPDHKVLNVQAIREAAVPKPHATRGEPSLKMGKSDPKGCLGVVTVFGGLFLVLALKSCFSNPRAPAAPPSAPAEAVAPPVVSPNAPEQTDEEKSLEDPGDDVGSAPSPVDGPGLAPVEIESPASQLAPPGLRTYFALVTLPDGTTTTLELMAPSPERAREILRDFRGNPEVIEGPSLEKTW